MQIDGAEDAAPVSSAAKAGSRKRKAEESPGAAGAVKLRRIEAQQDTLRDRMKVRKEITAAIVAGDVDVLKRLIEHDGELLEMEKPISRATPLLEAVWAGQFECVKQLLECGANANCVGAEYDSSEASSNPDYYKHFNPDERDANSFSFKYHTSPLVHAVANHSSNYVEFLVKYGADVTNQPMHIRRMLAMAIGKRDLFATKILLANYPHPLHFEKTDDLVLMQALRSEDLDIIRLIIEAISPEMRPQLLAQTLPQKSCNLETLELCCHYGLDLNSVVNYFECTDTTNTLLECMLLNSSFECASYMLQLGCDIELIEISRSSPVLRSVVELDLMKQLLPRIRSDQAREKFINALMFKLVDEIEDRLFLYPGARNASARFLIENGASPFFRWPDSDYTFHTAAATNDLDVILLFLQRLPESNFFFKGTAGKTPIGTAAEHINTQALQLLVSRLKASERQQVMKEEFRQACKRLHGRAVKNIEKIIDPETRNDVMLDTFDNALKTNDLEHLQNLVIWRDFDRINLLLELTIRNGIQPYHLTSSMQLCLSSQWLSRFRTGPLPLFSAQYRPRQILESIGKLTEKDGADARTAAFTLCQSAALSLPIGKDILQLHEALRYMQSAVVALPEIPGAIREQFGRFIVQALPAMASRNAYLLDDFMTRPAILERNGLLLTEVIVAQLGALYTAGEQLQVKFRNSLRKNLPRICNGCIAPETGLLQRNKLEKKLQKLGLFRQNALRVIDVLQLAYTALAKDDTVLSQPGNLLETNWRVQERFKERLGAKFAEYLAAVLDPANDGADVSLAASNAQTEFSRALRSLNEPDYMQAHGRRSLDNAFSATVGESFMALLWWQMDQVRQAFDLRLPGQEDWARQKLTPFLAFQQDLEKND